MTTPQVASLPERLVRWIPLPYWLTWMLIWQIILLADYMLGFSTPGGHDHITEFICLVLFFASVCMIIVYCSKLLLKLFADLRLFIDQSEEALTDWYQKKLRTSYQSHGVIVFALIFTIVVNLTAGKIMNQLSPPDSLLYYLRSGYQYVGFFFLGVGIWALLNVLLIPIALTNFRIRVSVNQVPGRGLQALGSAFFKMSLAITISFIPLVVAAIISPLLNDMSILIWMGAGIVFIFCFFLLPQIGIHKIMAYEKQQRLLSFAHHLEDAMERSLKDPTRENMQSLKDYFELQEHLKNMNEWPFNVSTLWQLLTALLIPLMLALLEIFF
jgi:hypothetical protein